MTQIFRLLLTALIGFFVLAGAVFLRTGADADSPPDPIPGVELETGGYDDAPDRMPEHGAKIAMGKNANAVLSLDLIADGGAGNRVDDGVTTGAVSGRGTTIAIEVFATGVRTSVLGYEIEFDFDATLLAFRTAEASTMSKLWESSTGISFFAIPPVALALAPSGFLARAEFETVADVTGREFSIGLVDVSLAGADAVVDTLTTASAITFNAMPSPDFDGDDFVGFTDFLIFAGAFGSSLGDGRYNAAQDLNSDGSVDFSDFLIFAGAFGSEVPPSGGGGTTTGTPDLIVESPTVDDNTLTTGQSFTLSATVRNQGNEPGAATTLRYYRSSNATISTDDTEVGTDAVSALSAGATSAESINLNAPSSAGTYYYGACVEGVSGENNTGNNCSDAVEVTVSESSGGSRGACKAGLVVNPGETCTYKGNTFSVSSSGRGSIAFFSAGTGIDARGANINGVRWNFHATKNSGSNSWTIHVAD